MKKRNLLITSLLLVAMFFAVILLKKEIVKKNTTEQNTTENISLTMYKSAEYTQPVYSDGSAQVHVTIEKVNSAGEGTVVWDKIFDPKYLSQYSSAGRASKEDVAITGIHKKSEYLVVKYKVNYTSGGGQLQIENGLIVKNSDSQNIAISI